MHRHGSKVVTLADNVIEHILEPRTPDNTLTVKNSIQERSGISHCVNEDSMRR
jgi:hypothetical protein